MAILAFIFLQNTNVTSWLYKIQKVQLYTLKKKKTKKTMEIGKRCSSKTHYKNRRVNNIRSYYIGKKALQWSECTTLSTAC